LKLILTLSCLLTLSGCSYNAATKPSLDPASSSVKINVIELTIDQLHQHLKHQQATCQAIVAQYIKRIEHYDQSSGLNSIILVNPNAINRAKQLDQKFTQTGTMKKLHCIPVILKDNFDTADMPTEAGSLALKGHLPKDDAFLVRQLRQHDAIILAKSNMGEWAFSPYHTISSTHGETRNAYSLEHVPAGSSGGTASAIAANFGIIGMGTDTGNSVRGPASHLALVGLRPTLGATSRDGIVPLLLNRDTAGPLMRTVTDTAIVYSVLAGPDPADPLTENPAHTIMSDYRPFLNKQGLQGARIALLDVLMPFEDTDPEVLDAMQDAIQSLRQAGATVIESFQINHFNKLTKDTGFCSRFRHDLNQYLKQAPDSTQLRSFEMLQTSQRYLALNQKAIDWASAPENVPDKRQPPCTDIQSDPRRKRLLDAVTDAMDAENIDAIIYPSWRYPPRAVGDLTSPHGNNSPVIVPHVGLPAITLPMGFTTKGLPLGLQFVGRPFSEALLLKYAYAYEQATLHRAPPEQFGPLQAMD
jgi:Asp-tRNA(Asn)/Glu-tRNA(Gln) amidotransferase A subunit family amidase